MPRPLGILTIVAVLLFGVAPALSQTAPAKPRSPGVIATTDRVAMARRAACQKEARAKGLSFMKRLSYVKTCVKR